MVVQGCDCSIVIKTASVEMDIPYSEETIREAVSLLREEAAIEGDGVCKAIKQSNGVTGCIVTPLTIGTAPLLLYLAMGSSGLPVFVSETRNMYRYSLNLLPLEDTDCFDVIQDRNSERLTYEGCRVKEFELRFMREEAIKLKLDIAGECPPVLYPYSETLPKATGERFYSNNVKYRINGKEYNNIYGLTLTAKKEYGTKTELWIKRILGAEPDIPDIIDELTITAQLLRDKYEARHFGFFTITVKRLVLTADETNINNTDSVVGPLRYYVAGTVNTEIYNTAGGMI